MRVFLFLILFGGSFITKAQFPYDYFNGKLFWEKIIIDKKEIRPSFEKTDTVCVVASTRIMQSDSFRCIGELRDEKMLRYFFVYSSNGNWHLHQVNSLRDAIQLLPAKNKDWVIYTEGMGKIFTSDLDRAMQMAAQYDVNVLLLDYPSIRTDVGSLHNYRFAMRNAKIAYKDFVPVIDSMKILKEHHIFGDASLCLFFHSMGNNVMREIVKNNFLFLFNDDVWVDNLILNAACVPRCGHKKWVDKIAFAKHIFIHYNPHDGTLKWGRIAGFHQVLGEHIKRPLSEKAVYINFNILCGKGHSNFLNLFGRESAKPEAIAYYYKLFHGTMPDVTDATLYAPSEYRHIGYEILPQQN